MHALRTLPILLFLAACDDPVPLDDTDTDSDTQISEPQEPFVDTDSDGLWDHIELQYGLNPERRDTDVDEIDDHWDLLGARLALQSFDPHGFAWFDLDSWDTISTANPLASTPMGIHVDDLQEGNLMVFGTATGRPLRVEGPVAYSIDMHPRYTVTMDASTAWEGTRDLEVRAAIVSPPPGYTFGWQVIEYVTEPSGAVVEATRKDDYYILYTAPTRRPPTQRLGPDTDADNLKDEDELIHGTDPFVWDTDGDGLPDGLEVFYGHDPLSDDTDGDGILDMDEYLDGTADIMTP